MLEFLSDFRKKWFPLPVQLASISVFVVLFGRFFGEGAMRSFYTFSVIYKEFLNLFLPFLIFAFITYGVLSFKKRAAIILAVLVSFILLSNFIVSFSSFWISSSLISFLSKDTVLISLVSEKLLIPWIGISLPVFIGPEKVILAAVVLGLVFSFVNFPFFNRFIARFKKIIDSILKKFFMPLLPVYILGFLLKASYEGTFTSLFAAFGLAFLLVLSLQIFWLSFLYFIAAGFGPSEFVRLIKNALPSYITAFTTMSSAASIPVTTECITKNVGDKHFAILSTPILANVHLIGDAISIPVFSLVTISMLLAPAPDIISVLTFVFFFCLTTFAISAVPGGGIFLVIPLLTKYLGFTSSMISIIITVYLLQDAFGSGCNVMGDGALSVLVHKVLRKLNVFEPRKQNV